MGILLLLIGIALAVTGWIVTQGVTDGIQYIVSAPEDKDALKDAYREAQVLLSSLTDLVDLAVVSGKAQHMTISTDISETEGTVYAVDLGFFDLRPEALKDGRLISGGDIKDYRDVAEAAMSCLDEGFESAMTVMTLPQSLRQYFRTSNHIERLNKELKRRSKVIGVFPNEASLLRLMGAVLMELNAAVQVRKAIFSPTSYNALLQSEVPAKLILIATEQHQLRAA